MSRVSITAILAAGAVAVGGIVLAAQDKYAVGVPGLAFSEVRGYEDWQTISISQTEDAVALVLGNPVIIEAYRSGIPGNGKPFPDGSKMVKIHWQPAKSEAAPAPTTIPGTLRDVDVMVRDSKRFADTGAWGYVQFNYDAASDTFTPLQNDTTCGFACHTIVEAKDYVFTAYPKR